MKVRARALATLVAAGLWATACGGDSRSRADAPVTFFSGPIPRNMAHRGGADRAPENTLEGFANGLALGAQILETDLHTTSDGVVVMLHDETVDRTTDGAGRVHDLSFAEVKTLDAGYRFTRDGGATFPWRGAGVEIPSLDEAFARFPAERFVMEIKQASPPMEAEVLDAVARHGMRERVCIASFDDNVVARVRALDPTICTSAGILEVADLALRPIEELEAEGVRARAAQIPPDVLGLPLITGPLVEKLQRLGVETHAWTIDDPDEMRALLDLGVEGIITDRPDVFEEVVAGLAPR